MHYTCSVLWVNSSLEYNEENTNVILKYKCTYVKCSCSELNGNFVLFLRERIYTYTISYKASYTVPSTHFMLFMLRIPRRAS